MTHDRKALLVAFHFPPIKASSGLERTLAMVKHLPKSGWTPIVLTASAGAYDTISNERLDTIPAGTVIKRAFARDATRLLSIGGRYPDLLAIPDKWLNWCLFAVPAGLRMIRQHRPSVIWSTYPIASAHIIGWALHRLTGLPWVADFRDPMVEYDSRAQRWAPRSNSLRRARLMIEGLAATNAGAMSFCTNSALRIAKDRYPQSRCQEWRVIENGYDESAFVAARGRIDGTQTENRLVLIHSGTIYPSPDRDPTYFLHAVRRFLDARPLGARQLKLVFRGSGVEGLYSDLLDQLRLKDTVHFLPTIGYFEALSEMCEADGVLLLQGYTSNPAIPAKLYEYVRAGRPILALTDSAGETAGLISRHQLGRIAPLDSVEHILEALTLFVQEIEEGATIPRGKYDLFERAHRVAEFAALFDQVTLDGKARSQ